MRRKLVCEDQKNQNKLTFAMRFRPLFFQKEIWPTMTRPTGQAEAGTVVNLATHLWASGPRL